jgi:hypothetical protein
LVETSQLLLVLVVLQGNLMAAILLSVLLQLL